MTHQAAHEDLAGGLWDSRSSWCRLGLFGGLGRLADTTDRAGWSGARSIRATTAAATTVGLAPSLENVVEAGIELGGHVDGDVVVEWVSEARGVRVDLVRVVVRWVWPCERGCRQRGAVFGAQRVTMAETRGQRESWKVSRT